ALHRLPRQQAETGRGGEMEDLVVADGTDDVGEVERPPFYEDHSAEHVPETDERCLPESAERPADPPVEQCQETHEAEVHRRVEEGERAVHHQAVGKEGGGVPEGEDDDPAHEGVSRYPTVGKDSVPVRSMSDDTGAQHTSGSPGRRGG